MPTPRDANDQTVIVSDHLLIEVDHFFDRFRSQNIKSVIVSAQNPSI
jgi:hypothetical protein